MPNIVNQSLLKILLVILTIHGLSPFTFTLEKGVVLYPRTPKKLLIYSIFIHFVVNVLLISATIYTASHWYHILYNDTIEFLLMVFEYCFNLAKGIVLFALHSIHHKKIAKLISEATKVHHVVNTFTQSSTLLHERVKKIIKMKLFSVFIQIAVSLPMIYSHSILDWAVFLYPQMLAMLASAIYIFGLMLLSLNCIICINSKLRVMCNELNRSNDQQLNENDIEKVSLLLGKIYEFTTTHNRLYGAQLTLTLIGSMALIMSAFFYSINSIIDLVLLIDTVDKIIYEHIYAIASASFHAIEIGSIVFVGDNISKEFHEMQRLLLKRIKWSPRTSKKDIEQISIQLSQLNLNINLCGMSPIQKPLMMAMCSTVVSYLTILVQFKLNENIVDSKRSDADVGESVLEQCTAPNTELHISNTNFWSRY